MKPSKELFLTLKTKEELNNKEIMFCIKNNQLKTLQKHISKKSFIDAINQQADMAFSLAINNHNPIYVKFIFDIITDKSIINKNLTNLWDDTPIMKAALFGDNEVIKFLLENGADVNSQNKSNYNALHWAVEYSNVSTIELLLNHGAKVSSGYNGRNALKSFQSKDIRSHIKKDYSLEYYEYLLSRITHAYEYKILDEEINAANSKIKPKSI